MADIVVLHWNLEEGGGAEAVCMHVLEALQYQHNVTLLTTTYPDLGALNQFYGTRVRSIDIRIPRIAGVKFKQVAGILESLTSKKLGYLRPLRYVLFHRICRGLYRDAELVFNTYTEMVTDRPTIQYIHYPAFNRSQLPDETIPDGRLFKFLDRLFNKLEGIETDSNGSPSNVMLTNSEWTADLIEGIYGREPRVVYPPIDTDEFGHSNFIKNRENGFITVGRLSADKNLLHLIEIISRVRDLGHDVHLHIIGPPFTPGYEAVVKKEASRHDYVHVEGSLSREQLITELLNHRYGLHGKRNEHFGMVVAEMVCAGVLPFIPNSGGQREIVDNNENLLYSDTADAVKKIDRVLSNPEFEREHRDRLPDIEERFSAKRFQTKVRAIIDESVKPDI